MSARPTLLVSLATAIAVVGALLTPVAASAVEPGTISGVVTLSSGAVGAKVTVAAIGIADDGLPFSTGVSTTSSTTGAFSLGELAPGTYTLRFSGAAGHYTQYLGGATTGSGARIVSLAGGENTSIRAALSAGGALAVTVKSKTGTAVSGARLVAYSRNTLGYWVKTATGATTLTGAFTFASLAPGSYLLQAYSSTGAFPSLYSGGAATLADAVAVDVAHGTTAKYAFTAVTTGTVTGILAGTHDGVTVAKLAGIRVALYRVGGTSGALTNPQRLPVTTVTSSTGKYTFTGLVPGFYTARFEPPTGESLSTIYASAYTGGTPDLATSQGLSVTAGGTTTLPLETLVEGAIITGTVSSLDATPLANVPVYLDEQNGLVDDGNEDVVGAETTRTDATGRYTIRGLPAGAWRIQIGTLSTEVRDDPSYNAKWELYRLFRSTTLAATTAVPNAFLTPDSTHPSLTQSTTISAAPTVATPVSVVLPTYSPAASDQTVEWLRDGIAIAGATDLSYTPRGTDAGRTLTARVTSRFYFLGTEVSESSGSVVALGPAPVYDFGFDTSGAVAVGSPITVYAGAYSIPGVSFDYVWCFDNNNDNVCEETASTAATFTPAQSHLGRDLLVSVVAHRYGYADSAADWYFVGIIGTGTLSSTKLPAVKKSGSTLTVSAGTWNSMPNSVSYSWKAYDPLTESFSTVGTQPSLSLSGLAGRYIRLDVVAAKVGYNNATVSVTAQTGTPGAATGATSIASTVRAGQTIVAPAPTWPADLDGAQTSTTYQWSYKKGTAWVKIGGATSASFAVPTSYAGKVIRVVLTARSAGFAAKTLTTNSSTVLVRAAPTMPLGVAITNSTPARIGSTLVATPSAWSVAATKTSYTWSSSVDGVTFTNISGATTAQFSVPESLFGRHLRLTVSGKKSGYATARIVTDLGPVDVGTISVTTAGSVVLVGDNYVLTLPKTVQATTATWTWNKGDPGNFVYQSVTGPGTQLSIPAAGLEGKVIFVEVSQSRANFATAFTSVYGPPPGHFSLTTHGTISGTAQVGHVLSVSKGTWTDSNVGISTFTYEWWKVDGSDSDRIEGATASTLPVTPDLAGHTVYALVKRELTGYESLGFFTNESSVIAQGSAPELQGGATVFVSGVPTVGAPAFAYNTDAWGEGVVSSIRWTRAADATVLGTNATYTPTVADYGSTLTVTVTATKPGHVSATATYTTPTVGKGELVPVVAPKVTKTGTVLSLVGGTWPTTLLTSPWSWVVYRANTTRSYVSTPTIDAALYPGTRIVAELLPTATGYNTGYYEALGQTGAASTYLGSAGIELTSTTASAVTIATQSQWSANPLFATVDTAFQWKRNGKAIAGATAATYTLQQADKGATLSVTVSKSTPGWLTGSKTFTAPTRVSIYEPLNPLDAPRISGTAAVGSTLTGSTGTWGATGLTFSYQWFGGADGYTPIAGATRSTYTPGPEQLGSVIRLRVSATKPNVTPEFSLSDGVTVAEGAAPTATATTSVSGTVLASKLTGLPAGFTTRVQWFTVAGGVPSILAGKTDARLDVAPSGTTYRAVYTITRPGFVTSTVSTPDVVH